MLLIHVLHQKALSKRGYSWTGKLVSSLLLTLTHTYPLENKFVNPQEWSSEGFPLLFYQPWGMLKVFLRVQEKSPSPLGKGLRTERHNSVENDTFICFQFSILPFSSLGTSPMLRKSILPFESSKSWLIPRYRRWKPC